MKKTTLNRSAIALTRTACVTALYYAMTVLLQPISYGVFQFRISEALTMLPLLFPEAIAGLALGCLLANITSPFGILDMLLGAAITLAAAILTRIIKKPFVAPLPPILLNALLLPLILLISGSDVGYFLTAASLLVSQALVIYGLGLPLYFGLKRCSL